MSRVEKILIWIGVLTLGCTVLAAVAAWVVVPEFRQWTGLEKPPGTDAKPQAAVTPQSIPAASQIDPAKDELPGTWVDTKFNWFYQFLDNGKVTFRFHRFDNPSGISENMTWYRIGQVIHFSDTEGLSEICTGALNGGTIRGNCRSPRGVRNWIILRLDNQPPPQKAHAATPRRPLPTDGIWLDDSLRANDKQVFLELIPNGKVRVRLGVDGTAIMSQNTWYQIGDAIHLTEFITAATIECEGKLEGDTIEGTRHEVKTNQLSPPSSWKLQRVKK
jgi:hypothetical protein